VTTGATITCIHGGQVILTPRQTTVTIAGNPVLREGDLAGAPILGCLQPPTPATKPCTAVISTLPGSASTRVMAAGAPVLLATLTGITDGVPPGGLLVISPGQATVQAT
jgi:hypothetical protein